MDGRTWRGYVAVRPEGRVPLLSGWLTSSRAPVRGRNRTNRTVLSEPLRTLLIGGAVVKRPRAAHGGGSALLGQPHSVQLLIDVVAGRNRPASHFRAVRDDPVMLQRWDEVRLVVEQPLLELADEPPSLRGIGRSTLLL